MRCVPGERLARTPAPETVAPPGVPGSVREVDSGGPGLMGCGVRLRYPRGLCQGVTVQQLDQCQLVLCIYCDNDISIMKLIDINHTRYPNIYSL